MNLEDRLRGHLNSGEDFFDESGPDAGMIAAAGQRRTRRNQVGGALAAGIVLIGLVVGGTNVLRDSSPDEFAGPDVATTDDEALIDESAEIESFEDPRATTEATDADPLADDSLESAPEAIEDDVIAEDADLDDSAMTSEMFDGPLPPIETVVGTFDGFIGLRDTDGTITAITSSDGVAWDEIETDVPDGITIIALDTNGLTVAGTFARFDGSGEPKNFIGTSVDLANWDLIEIDLGAGGFGGVAVKDGLVVASAVSIPSFSEDAEVFTEPVPMVAVGLAGGPYELIEFGDAGNTVDQLVATDFGFAASVFGETTTLATSVDGRAWELVELPGAFADFATPHVVEGAFFATAHAEQIDIYRFDDEESAWTLLPLPEELSGRQWFSAPAVSNERRTAWQFFGETENVLVTVVDGGLVTVSTDGFVEPGIDWMLTAVSDDELLLQVFAPPGVDVEDGEPMGPNYVRIPLP